MTDSIKKGIINVEIKIKEDKKDKMRENRKAEMEIEKNKMSENNKMEGKMNENRRKEEIRSRLTGEVMGVVNSLEELRD